MDQKVAKVDSWLEELRTRLTEDLEAQKVNLRQLTADTGDPGELDTQSALIAKTRKSVEEITEALRRMDEGRYGVCDRCGGQIPRARLEVVPHARYCVPCQERQAR